jgi:hypothetical protein
MFIITTYIFPISFYLSINYTLISVWISIQLPISKLTIKIT